MKSANELLLGTYVTERKDTCQTWQEFRKKSLKPGLENENHVRA